MGETVEFKAEQRAGVSGIPELFRGVELLASDMERLEHCATGQLVRRSLAGKCHLPRSSSLTEVIRIVISADRNTCSSTVCQFVAAIPLLFFDVMCMCIYMYIYMYIK